LLTQNLIRHHNYYISCVHDDDVHVLLHNLALSRLRDEFF
jgi:hypothetical protein